MTPSRGARSPSSKRLRALLCFGALVLCGCGPAFGFVGTWLEPEDSTSLCVNGKCARIQRTWLLTDAKLTKSASCNFDELGNATAQGEANLKPVSTTGFEVLGPLEQHTMSTGGSLQFDCSVKALPGIYAYELHTDTDTLGLLTPGGGSTLVLTRKR